MSNFKSVKKFMQTFGQGLKKKQNFHQKNNNFEI